MLSLQPRTILAAVALTVACSNDSPTDPPLAAGDPGAVSFAYSGSGDGGTFAAQGMLNPDPVADPTSQSFAVALDFAATAGAPFYEIVALNVAPPKIDIFGILLSGRTTGSYPITTEDFCSGPSQQTSCALAWYILGFDPEGSSAPVEYVLTSGTVEVTSITNGRLKGTFQGSAQQVSDGGGSTGPFVDGVTIEVVSGTFDVPVVADQGWILLPNRLPADVATLLRGDARPALTAWRGARKARPVR